MFQDHSDISIGTLAKCESWPSMTCQLLFSLAQKQDKVINGIRVLFGMLGSDYGDSDVTGLFQDRMLAILVQFDARLNDDCVTRHDKAKVLLKLPLRNESNVQYVQFDGISMTSPSGVQESDRAHEAHRSRSRDANSPATSDNAEDRPQVRRGSLPGTVLRGAAHVCLQVRTMHD